MLTLSSHKRTWLLSLVFCLTSLVSFAQLKYPVTKIHAEKQGRTLRNPWCGGLNSPMFSPADFNQDGLQDLFVYDRVGEKVLTFLNNGSQSDTAYSYAPRYEYTMPRLKFWAFARDYNHDGVPDLFSLQTGGLDNGVFAQPGIKVHKGIVVDGEVVYPTVSYFLRFQFGANFVNLYASVDELPALTDVNRDGDLDVLIFGLTGSFVEYYQNMTHEMSLPYDTFLYEQHSQCWGHFAEDNFTNSIDTGIYCANEIIDTLTYQPHDNATRHSGSTLFAFDDEDDHDTDLILGDIAYNTLVQVRNCGDSTLAHVCWYDTAWPQCSGISAYKASYPGAYGIDANNNGTEDILVSPCTRQFAGEDTANVQLYRNNATTCGYEYVSDSFFVSDILDFGTGSKVQFFDYNSDGLLDVVVGNYGYYSQFQPYTTAMAIYENIGSDTVPMYRLRSLDYSNLSNYSSTIIAFYPAFGDLDGDGKKDLVVGNSNGYLYFFHNQGNTVANFNQLTNVDWFGIDVGSYASPCIYDVNGDSLNDLVIGNRLGGISYYWNFGTPTTPLFSPDSVNASFGNISVNEVGVTEGYSAPQIIRDSTGRLLLFSGSVRGTVFLYEIDTAHLRNGSFAKLDSNYLHYDAGTQSTIAIADLNNDGRWDYLLGNSRGGLQMFSDTSWDSINLPIISRVENLQDELQYRVYPNPANDFVTIEGSDLHTAHIELFSMIGKAIVPAATFSGNKAQLNIGTLANGLYLLHISGGGRSFAQKILVQH